MKVIDIEKDAKVIGNQEMRNIARQGITKEVAEYGFWSKLFGLTPVRIIDANIVAKIKDGRTTFYIRLYYKQMRVFGEASFSRYKMACFPGGDDYVLSFDDREAAIDELLRTADVNKFIPGQGGIF